MGVDITKLVIKHEKSLSSFKGKKIAIDALNALYQFMASIRQQDGTPLKDFKGETTSHLSGIFYRTLNLIENEIEPIYVFDGVPPDFKQREIQERIQRKKEAQILEQKARDAEDLEKIKTYAQQSIRLTKKHKEEAMQVLEYMGVPYLVAPSEGEAQAAYMAKKGLVYASASQDYDSLLFQAPKLVRNLSITGRRKLPRKNEYVFVHPEEVNLKEVLAEHKLSQEELVIIGMLVGTDFNKGVKGIGPKKALKIVKDQMTFEKVISLIKHQTDHEFEDYIEDVYNFFLNPPVKDLEIKASKEVNKEKLHELMVETHDFSKDRIENALEKLNISREKQKQSSLNQWFS